MTVTKEDVALKEFEALRAEIVSRQQQQAASIGVGLTAIGTLVGFALAKENPRTEMLLAIPLVLTGLACFYIWNARFTRRIGRYLKGLSSAFPVGSPSWEARVATYRGKTILEALGVAIVFIVPSVVSLLVTDEYRDDKELKPLWYAGWVLLGLLVLFLLVSIVSDWLAERSQTS